MQVCGECGSSFAEGVPLGMGAGVSCCAAQTDRDPSETPPQHEGWSTTEDESAGVWGVWFKLRGGCSLRDGCGRCAPLDATVRLISPHAEKQGAPTLHTHAPAPPRTPLHAECLMSRVCACVASGTVALCRHVNA